MEDRNGTTSASVSDEEVPVFSLTAQEQEEVLRACHPDIKNMLDYDQIFPYLNRHGLLTSSDQEKLDTLPGRGQKIDWLVRSLPRKGSEAVWKFLDSLKCTVDGTAHAELMSLLQEQVDEIQEKKKIIGTQGVWIKRGKVVFYIFVVMLLLAVVLLVWSRRDTLLGAALYHSNQPSHSRLPYPTEHFVGRDKERDELAQLLSCDNTDVRIISIYGPPGIGKTTLGIHIGHKLTGENVYVYYVKVESSSMQALAEKVLASVDTLISTENVTIERLMKWAGDIQQCTVLFLDNCDKALYEQEGDSLHSIVKQLLESSAKMKVLMTSRQSISQVGKRKRHELRQLSVDASCPLLQALATEVEVTRSLCEEIAYLTGSNPLALQVVGALLATSLESKTIVAKLKQQPISTLSPKELLPEERVNVSINISYQYLSPELQEIGRYLANFPGSFDRDAACVILPCIPKNITCDYISSSMDQLARQSLLEFSRQTTRFQFHNLIRQFFVDIQRVDKSHEARCFSVNFQMYYSDQLRIFNNLYVKDRDHIQTLAQTHRSLMRLQLHHNQLPYMYLSELYNRDHMYPLAELDVERHNIQHLLSEVAMNYEFLNFSQYCSVVVSIEEAVDSRYLNCKFTVEELQVPLKSIVQHLSITSDRISGQHSSERAQARLCSDLLVKTNRTLFGLIELSQNLSDKVRSYEHVSEAYFRHERYEESAHYLELALQEPNRDPFDLVSLRYKLVMAMLHLDEINKATANLREIESLSPQLMNADALTWLQKSFEILHLRKIESLLHLKVAELTLLENMLVTAIHEVGAKTSVAKDVKELAQYVLEQGNYTKVVDLARFGKESMKHLSPSQRRASTGLKLDLEILIGRANFLAGNYSEGLDNLVLVIDDIYKLGVSSYPEQYETVCPYVLLRLRFGCLRYPLLRIGANTMQVLFGLLLDPPVTISDYRALLLHHHQLSQWPLQSSFGFAIRFIVNVIWVCYKLMLVVYMYKCMHYCMSCFYSLVIMYIQVTLPRIPLGFVLTLLGAAMAYTFGPGAEYPIVMCISMCGIFVYFFLISVLKYYYLGFVV